MNIIRILLFVLSSAMFALAQNKPEQQVEPTDMKDSVCEAYRNASTIFVGSVIGERSVRVRGNGTPLYQLADL